jgi:hypothetical protein
MGFAVCYGHNTRQTRLPGRLCQTWEGGLPCACMVAHGKDQAHGKPSFQENSKIFYKSLPCALISSRQRFTVCNTRQTLPSGYPTSVSRRQSLFFRRVSSLTHGKASPCAKNLAVCKGKVRRGVVCRVFFAVSNTRQSLRRVLLRLCRVREAHGEPPESGSMGTKPRSRLGTKMSGRGRRVDALPMIARRHGLQMPAHFMTAVASRRRKISRRRSGSSVDHASVASISVCVESPYRRRLYCYGACMGCWRLPKRLGFIVVANMMRIP